MDLSSIQPLLDWLSLHQEWVAAAIVFIAFLESLALAGVVIPGVVMLFGVSAIAGTGALGIWPTLACAFTGAVLGDGISFFLGKTFKQRIKELWPFRKYPEWISNGEKFFALHGGKSIVAGRFIGPIRPVMPLIAGMLNMPTLRFIAVNLFSALGWAPFYMIPGYLFGASLQAEIPQGIGQLLIYSGIILAAGWMLIKISHWQLSPTSPLYRALQRWADTQHNTRIFWHWVADHRGEQPAFPLPAAMLLLTCLLALAVNLVLATHTGLFDILNQHTATFFAVLHHPWLDLSFANLYRLTEPAPLFSVTLVFSLWLCYRRHFAATAHIICALFALETLLRLTGSIAAMEIARATLIFSLFATFISQELAQDKRWRAHTTLLLPILLVALAVLYLGNASLYQTLNAILLGLIICAATRFSFGRYNRKPIKTDLTFWGVVAVTLIGLLIYII